MKKWCLELWQPFNDHKGANKFKARGKKLKNQNTWDLNDIIKYKRDIITIFFWNFSFVFSEATFSIITTLVIT